MRVTSEVSPGSPQKSQFTRLNYSRSTKFPLLGDLDFSDLEPVGNCLLCGNSTFSGLIDSNQSLVESADDDLPQPPTHPRLNAYL